MYYTEQCIATIYLILASESSQNYSVSRAIFTKKHIAVFYWITNTVQIHELKDTNRRGILRYTSYPSVHTTMFSFKTLHWQFDTVYFNMYTYSLIYISFTYTWLDLFKGDKINVETQISKMQKEVGGVMSSVVEKVN